MTYEGFTDYKIIIKSKRDIMMTDRELLEKIAAQMNKGFKDVNGRIEGLQDEIQVSLTDVRNEIKVVNTKFDDLQEEMIEGFREAYNERQEIKSDTKEIKMTIENDINKNISLLVEGQKNINDKIDEILKFKDEKEMLTIRIEILENELERMKTRLGEIA